MNDLRIVLGDLNSVLQGIGQESPRFPALELLIYRGDRRPVPPLPESSLAPWQRVLLFELGLPADQRHALAPLEWLGRGGDMIGGTWLRAELVHLAVGPRSVSIRDVPDLSAANYQALIVALNEILHPIGFELFAVRASDETTHLFLHTTAELDLHFPTNAGDAEDARNLFPQGAAAPLVRRLMTEVQMVLHDHEINRAREDSQLPAINALVLSGAGYIDGPAGEHIPSLAGDNPYVHGLAKLHGSSARSLSAVTQAFPEDVPALVVVPIDAAPGDMQALVAFERVWASPLVEALRRRQLRALELLTVDARIRVTASDLPKFWRRLRPLAKSARGWSGQS